MDRGTLMTIGKPWLFIIGVIAALAILAPDSQVGGEIRNMFSQLRGATSTFMDTAGRGSQEVGGFVEE